MLVIRMQRTGRKGHAMFRVIVQDSRLTPTSGKVVAQLGSYDPHAKIIVIDKEKAAFYLEHGAQPSERVARLLKKEGVKLPEWVKQPAVKKRTVRNADKRRSTRPPAPVEDVVPAEAETEAEAIEEVSAEHAEQPESNEETAAEAVEPTAEEPSEAEAVEQSSAEVAPTEDATTV